MGLFNPPSTLVEVSLAALTWMQLGTHLAGFCWFCLSHGSDKRQNDQVGTVMSWPPAGFILCPYWVKPFKGLAHVFGPQCERGRVVVSCCDWASSRHAYGPGHHQRELGNRHASRLLNRGCFVCLFICMFSSNSSQSLLMKVKRWTCFRFKGLFGLFLTSYY